MTAGLKDSLVDTKSAMSHGDDRSSAAVQQIIQTYSEPGYRVLTAIEHVNAEVELNNALLETIRVLTERLRVLRDLLETKQGEIVLLVQKLKEKE